MQRPKHIPETPSQFYRLRRPEYFSDSFKSYEVKLPKEHLSFELSQISTNQKQDGFETLCRRLSEIFIAPNLIPQVGPTGGGDGKTDFETYPVSQIISDRWFVPENGWKSNENWAFAISAKEDWKNKAKSDISKIIGTGRGYTRVYFITNQKPSSKKKKDAQDEFNKEFKIEVIILDGEWIIEKIYSSDLINLVVDSLNLSDVYKKEKIDVGERDTYRLKQLEKLEESINNPNRHLEQDYQLVEDAIESAILTRMLEKPKDEVVGKFDRALRFGNKLNNTQQLLRIHYQRAWTFINWYDDYSNFIAEYNSFKVYLQKETTVTGIELCFNLINLLRGVLGSKNADKQKITIDFAKEEKELRETLDVCIKNTTKPSTSIIAKTYKSFLNIFAKLTDKSDVSPELKLLKQTFEESQHHLEYPFESFKKIVEIFGEILPDNKDYDDLIDSLAGILETRASELASGQTFLKRGYQKLDKGYHKESVIYFGKAVLKLAKEESQDGFYFSLLGLYQAYSDSGLYWAAYNSLIAAMSISIKEWYNGGVITKRFYNCVKEAIKIELFIGRVPLLLNWHELYQVIARQFEANESDESEIPTPQLVDGCLSVRLINTPYEKWNKLLLLPDLLEKETLWLSQDTCLFMLGYLELLPPDYLNGEVKKETFDDYYGLVANQPFKEQMVYETNFLDDSTLELNSIILGTKFCVSFARDKYLMFFAEMTLAYFESFLATSYSDVFPSTEIITIQIKDTSSSELYKIINDVSSSDIQLLINFEKIKESTRKNISNILLELTSLIIGRNFVMKDAKGYLETLFKKEELHERQSLIFEHHKFITNILGENPKIFLEDWYAGKTLKEFPFKRDENPVFKYEKKLSESGNVPHDIKDTKHNQRKVFSIIDTHLWDKAHWTGFGFLASREINLGIFLAFENGDIGKQIFENWIKQFGKEDKNEEIKISIVKGVNKSHPTWYRVQVSKNISKTDFQNGDIFVSAARFHEMNAESPTNLNNLINGYNYFKKFWLFPAKYKPDGGIEPYLETGILKTSLTIRNAWEIGEQDFDSVVIKKEDDPIIPKDITDAPVIKLLKRKRSEE